MNAFWRDFAQHDPATPFLSRNLAEASRNFPEMLLALAVLDLPFEAAKFFGYSDIVDMPLLLFSFGAAIYWRKDRHMHSRLMAVTVLTSIVPALARMFNILVWGSFEGLYHAMHPTYLLILGVLGFAILSDKNSDRLSWPLPLARDDPR